MDNKNIVLVFDYDGTIQDTMKIYEPAVIDTAEWLRSQGYSVPDYDRDRIKSWLGQTNEEMWSEFAPKIDEAVKEAGGKRIGALMRRAVSDGTDAWFSGARETLDLLKSCGYRMIVLSNCDHSYAEFNSKFYEMDRWFEAYIDCESYGWRPKSEVLSEIIATNPEPNYVMIGDRHNDRDAAVLNGIPFVACSYGYADSSELEGASASIDSVDELPIVIEKLIEF